MTALTKIIVGMENGVPAIEKNFEELDTRTEDTGWVDASKYLTSAFKVYTGHKFEYRQIGKVVYFSGVISPAADITDSGTEQAFAQGLPFSFHESHLMVTGSGNAHWSQCAIDDTLTFSRYTNSTAAASGDFSVCKAGTYLAVGGAFAID